MKTKPNPNQTFRDETNRVALLVVACNTILQTVCDRIKHTQLYRLQIKQLTDRLTKEVERFMVQLYDGMSEAEEMQYHDLVSTVEEGMQLIATCTPNEVKMLTAWLKAHRAGEVHVQLPKTDA